MKPTIARGDGRILFAQNALAYTTGRPAYPDRVREVLGECGAEPGCRAFEIGAGSGQATSLLLEAGCQVTAIEPAEDLVKILNERLSTYSDNLSTIVSTFEDVEIQPESFDLGVAAMSLHWIQPELALTKAYRLLKPGGRWIMWWNIYADVEDMDEFQKKTQPMFQSLELSPSQGSPMNVPFALDKKRRYLDLKVAGFSKIFYEEFRWRPLLSTKQVVDLIATFSPVLRLPDVKRKEFLNGIATVADDFGGYVARNFITAIYTARRE